MSDECLCSREAQHESRAPPAHPHRVGGRLMATWHYTNPPGAPTITISFPNHLGGQDAVIPGGVTLTFNAASSDDMTIYDTQRMVAAEGDANAIHAAASRRGKVRDIAQPGDGH